MIKSTAQTIVGAALETLREEGFAGASSRAIARRGGFNQALIFYHYGSVDDLLLAALDRTSEERLARYRTALADVADPGALLVVARSLYEEDRASGHMTVVSQMVAGSLARRELAPKVLARMVPWLAFAEETISRIAAPLGLDEIVPPRELASAALTFYLGVNLLTNLDPESGELDALFARGAELAPLLGSLLR
jgi:AcrR family transcriptional regulator